MKMLNKYLETAKFYYTVAVQNTDLCAVCIIGCRSLSQECIMSYTLIIYSLYRLACRNLLSHECATSCTLMNTFHARISKKKERLWSLWGDLYSLLLWLSLLQCFSHACRLQSNPSWGRHAPKPVCLLMLFIVFCSLLFCCLLLLLVDYCSYL